MSHSLDTTDTKHDFLPGWKGKLQAMNEKWEKIEVNLLVTLLALMCLGAASQWLMRLLFNVGYVWIGEMTTYALMWTGFIGGSIATSRIQHFRIDLVRLIPPENRNISTLLRTVSYLTGALFCVILMIASAKYILMVMEYSEKSSYGMPLWPVYIVVFYFYAVSSARFFLSSVFKITKMF